MTTDVWALAETARRTTDPDAHRLAVDRLRAALGVVPFDPEEPCDTDPDRPDETRDPSAATVPTSPSVTPGSPPTSAPCSGSTVRPSESAPSGSGAADVGVVGWSLSQQRLKGDAAEWTRREKRKGRKSSGRGGEPMVELTIRRRPAGSSLGSGLAERIYRAGNPVQRVRVPLSQKGKARRDLDRSGWRVEAERQVRR